MPFDPNRSRLSIPLIWRVFLVSIAWLALISGLHVWLNVDTGSRRVIKMGYMPVITNLAAPLLDEATRKGDGVRFEALKFSSFADMGEALRNGQIQVAFIIAPLSIVLRQQGEDVKIVYIGNRHESTLVVRKDLNIRQLKDLTGRTVAVPMRYSGHNICLMGEMEKQGLTGQIHVVEMNPPDMAPALAVGSLDAYFVGEPFAARSLKSANADVLFYVEHVRKGFICNLILVKNEFIENEPEIVRMLVQGAARSGFWARQNPQDAAEIASQYWNTEPDLVEYALTTPEDRIVYDQFIPKLDEMQHIADQMEHFGLIPHNTITGLVDDRFAKAADLSHISNFKSILFFDR